MGLSPNWLVASQSAPAAIAVRFWRLPFRVRVPPLQMGRFFDTPTCQVSVYFQMLGGEKLQILIQICYPKNGKGRDFHMKSSFWPDKQSSGAGWDAIDFGGMGTNCQLLIINYQLFPTPFF